MLGKRTLLPALIALLALFVARDRAWANVADYLFMETTGTPTDMSDAEILIGAGLEDEVNEGPISIGFPFRFDGAVYTQFSVNENGWIRLGPQPLPTFTYDVDLDSDEGGDAAYPMIAPFWNDNRTFGEDGYVRYNITGEAGSRILTVEWRVTDYNTELGGPWVYQLRLHEYDSRIEFYYEDLNSLSIVTEEDQAEWDEVGGTIAAIGIATSPTNFASITPGPPATIDYEVSNDFIDIRETPIENGTMYVFYVCPTVAFVGDVSEGGTPGANDGDVFFEGRELRITGSETSQPLIVQNSNASQPHGVPMDVTFTLDDPTGLYSIDQESVTLGPGQSFAPSITFNADLGEGFYEATLTVTAGCGETRTYTLRYFIDETPAGQLLFGGNEIGPDLPLFVDQVACVGEGIVSIPIIARNIGGGDFTVYDLVAYAEDTLIQDGTPTYPIIRDEFGMAVRAPEYFLSRSPGVAPRNGFTGDTGFVIPEGQSMTLYLNYVPSLPGRQHARLCFRTSAENVSGFPVDPIDDGGESTAVEPVLGLICADAFARGSGAFIASARGARFGRPEPIIFEQVEVGMSVLDTFRFMNDGECNMRIRRSEFRFEAGDVREFQVVSHNLTTGPGGDYLLEAGDSARIIVRFTPSRSGSRRATMRVVTNDSTLQIPGITERGIYYWEAYGEGKAGLEAIDVRLAPAVIDAESSTGEVVLSNTRAELVRIDSIRISGGNGEILRNPSTAWPTEPRLVLPGEQIRLGVILTPAPGSEEGERQAEVLVYLSNGDTVRAMVRGYAGTRTLEVAPAELFAGAVLEPGTLQRRFFTVTNVGTLPVTISSMDLAGAGATDYRVAPLRRATLQPGQTEYFEVTYAPSDATADDATITIVSNATNGDQVITLSGDGATSSTVRDDDGGASRGISSVQTEAVSGGLTLGQSVPNPARGATEIRYRVAKAGEVTLKLYDGQGRLVRVLDAGTRGAGEHVVRVEVGNLPSGEYHYRLEQGGEVVSRRMVVAH